MAWRGAVPRMEASTHVSHEETTMPDLFEALSLIAASGVAAERSTTHHRPDDDGAGEAASPVRDRRSERRDVRDRRRDAPVRRSGLLGWSR